MAPLAFDGCYSVRQTTLSVNVSHLFCLGSIVVEMTMLRPDDGSADLADVGQQLEAGVQDGSLQITSTDGTPLVIDQTSFWAQEGQPPPPTKAPEKRKYPQ